MHHTMKRAVLLGNKPALADARIRRLERGFDGVVAFVTRLRIDAPQSGICFVSRSGIFQRQINDLVEISKLRGADQSRHVMKSRGGVQAIYITDNAKATSLRRKNIGESRMQFVYKDL